MKCNPTIGLTQIGETYFHRRWQRVKDWLNEGRGSFLIDDVFDARKLLDEIDL